MQIEIRALNDCLKGNQREVIERRLLYALGRFSSHVQSALVRLEDVNGPRGGLDQRCAIHVRLRRGGKLVVDVHDIEQECAVSRAADRIARRVRDWLSARRDQQRRPVMYSRLPAA